MATPSCDINLSDEEREKLANLYRERYGHIADEVHDEPHPRDTLYTRYVKRALDVAISAAALVVTSPVNAVLAVLTYRDVGTPIIFRQKRIGKDGKSFNLVKFRNMTNDTDERGNLLLPEERVTEFGKKVRASSLDELLNFWSVFKGDMSIIGPRPLLPEYTDRYCARHRARLSVKPGLECPQRKQLGHYPTWEEQFENEVWYAENVSLGVDLGLFLHLVQMVFDGRKSAFRGQGGRSTFMGYGPDGRAISYIEIPQDDKLWAMGGVDG